MSSKWKLIALLVAIGVCFGAGPARADVLLSPTDSIATLNRLGSDTPGDTGASGNTRDGSGFTGGLVDIGADPAESTTVIWYVKPSSQGGYPGPADPPETIFYDLGAERTFDAAVIWQAVATGYGRPDDIDVDYTNVLGGGGSFSQPWAAGSSSPSAPTSRPDTSN
jgi:hypothetical protein